MQSKKSFLTLCCLMALSVFLVSCSPALAPNATVKPAASVAATEAPAAETPAAKSAPPASTPKPAADQPKYGGILTFPQSGDPPSYDIHQEATGQTPPTLTPAFNGLLQYDPLAWPEAKIVADLAASWEISPDGLEYKFQLKSGVKWHDGKPLASQDVKTSLDRIRMPPKEMKSPRQGTLHAISNVEAVAGDQVRIKLRYPSAALTSILAVDYLAILPKHIIDAKGDMKRDILGTGPFKLKEAVPGTSYQYVKNSDYFVKDRPYLDGITIYIIKDESTRFAALRTGRVLHLPYPYGVSGAQAENAQADPRLVVVSNWRPTIYHFYGNTLKAPWSDPKVRRAVSLAVDREAFIKTALEGDGFVGAHMASKGLWGIPEDELFKLPGFRQPKDADLAEAKRLLADAGYPQGFETVVTTREQAQHQKLGTMALSELGKIGIKGKLDINLPASFDDKLRRGAFDSVCHGEAVSIDDPDLLFGDLYLSSGGRNYARYSSPKIDELFEKQSRALDVDSRRKIVREMMTILLEDNPDVTIGWGISRVAHSVRLKNYKMASSPYINNRYQEAWLGD